MTPGSAVPAHTCSGSSDASMQPSASPLGVHAPCHAGPSNSPRKNAAYENTKSASTDPMKNGTRRENGRRPDGTPASTTPNT
eukprot:364640-Chlamydomonas_euryale.AAC.9